MASIQGVSASGKRLNGEYAGTESLGKKLPSVGRDQDWCVSYVVVGETFPASSARAEFELWCSVLFEGKARVSLHYGEGEAGWTLLVYCICAAVGMDVSMPEATLCFPKWCHFMYPIGEETVDACTERVYRIGRLMWQSQLHMSRMRCSNECPSGNTWSGSGMTGDDDDPRDGVPILDGVDPAVAALVNWDQCV